MTLPSPAACRSFLLEVGAGGAGPDYGVFPLRHDTQGWHWVTENKCRSVNAHLSQSFPSMAERARWATELENYERQEQDFPDDQSYRIAFHSWDDEWERVSDAMPGPSARPPGLRLLHLDRRQRAGAALSGPASGPPTTLHG